MAKKSAKSKGYRKTITKKPYLGKKDIIWLCVIVALLAVGAFFLFRYDDGALKVQDGAVLADGDNWLIADGSNVRGRSRYYKLGEIGELEGYAREKGTALTDVNIPQYNFTAEAEGNVETLNVTCSHNAAETLAKYTMAQLEGLPTTTLGELQSVELARQTVRYFISDIAPAEAEEAAEEASEPAEEAAEATEEAAEEVAEEPAEGAEEAEDSRPYARTISGYVDASHDCCVIIRAEGRADTAEGCPAEDALVAALEQGVSAITLEEGK